MSNYIQKQNIFYKGRIYSECDISVPNSSDYSDEGLYEHDLKMFKNYLLQVPSCEYNGLQIEDGVSVEKVNGVWVAITKEQSDNSIIIFENHDRTEMTVSTEEKKEETQEELWNNVGIIFHPPSVKFTAYSHIQKELQDKFTITRK